MSDERPPPDFAMLRAVEVLARIASETRGRSPAPAPRLDHPLLLRGDRATFALGMARSAVVRAIGEGGPYPVAGWSSYALPKTRAGWLILLSLFYRDDALFALELYRSRAEELPALPRISLRARLHPTDVAIGNAIRVAPHGFANAQGGPGRIVYSDAFEARFPGGVAFVMGNDGVAERLVLYAQT